MAATQTEEQVPLKLLVNKERNKVLFAEAGKDFVDALFSFLTLPLGTIARLVSKESNMPPVRVGCLNSLYESVSNLDEELLWTERCKEMLLQPRNSSEAYCRNLKLKIDDTEPTKYLICPDLIIGCSSRHVSTFKTIRCGCGKLFSQSISLMGDNACEGFVSRNATFIITDDLIVVPNSMDTCFGLLQNRGLENIDSVQEMTLNVTKKKVMDLLKCSLLSNSSLTDFFLEKKPLLERSRFSPCDVAANGSIQINIKLIMRKSDGKLLFAQGEEDFADFLFSFLTFPLGGVVRMLEGHSSVGSVDGLYKSIADLNENKYFVTKEVKNLLVDPRLAPQFKLSKQILPIWGSYAPEYICYYNRSRGITGSIINNQCYLSSKSTGYGGGIDSCAILALALVDPRSSTGGYAKGPTMYMASDDLVVAPVSPISVISLLSRLNTSLGDLNEKAVTIGIKEGLNILKASLTSTSALTNGLSHLLAEVKEE